MLNKALCSIGLHRYMHVVEEWEYAYCTEFFALGVQSFHKVCRCGHRKEMDEFDPSRLPFVAAPVYSYLNR